MPIYDSVLTTLWSLRHPSEGRCYRTDTLMCKGTATGRENCSCPLATAHGHGKTPIVHVSLGPFLCMFQGDFGKCGPCIKRQRRVGFRRTSDNEQTVSL